MKNKHSCCDGECHHDDCCGKVEVNCPSKMQLPEPPIRGKSGVNGYNDTSEVTGTPVAHKNYSNHKQGGVGGDHKLQGGGWVQFAATDPVAQERERILDKIDQLARDIIRNEAQEMSNVYVAKMSLIQDIEEIINNNAS